MAIEFKSPSEQDIEMMREFAAVVDGGLELLGKPEISHVAHVVASKLQEALMWFSHGVLNTPVVNVAAAIAGAVAEGTAEEVPIPQCSL